MRDPHTPQPHSSGANSQRGCNFLHGCDLPKAWAGRLQWRILDTDFACGLHFLKAWHAWRADPQRPTLLHFVAAQPHSSPPPHPPSCADLKRPAALDPALAPLVHELQSQWWGLLPGVHRLRFDEGRVHLTLHIGAAHAMLRGQSLTADSVYLHDTQCGVNDVSRTRESGVWDQHAFKSLARCCRRGTQLVCDSEAPFVRTALAQVGFEVARPPNAGPQQAPLHATFNPAWEPRGVRHAQAPAAVSTAGECLVIGGGIAGAAAAASLARRGWRVRVLDQARAPAAGASGLPAGVFAPHISPDDSVLSRLTRSGVRTTLEQASWLLQSGVDWSPCGVLERAIAGADSANMTGINANINTNTADADTVIGLPRSWQQGAPGSEWSQAASVSRLAQAGLPPTATACWHHKAGWIRPARLIAALLKHPHIEWQGDSAVAQLRRIEGVPTPKGAVPPLWQALDACGQVLAEAPTVIIAAGAGSAQLLEHRWPLQPVRGQVSWGVHADSAPSLAPFPINGHGNLVPCFALQDTAQGSSGWLMGSTFERDTAALPPTPAEARAAHAANWGQLQTLLPTAATQLQAQFSLATAAPSIDGTVPSACAQPLAAQSWAAVRCTSPDRLPIVGPVDAATLPGLWVCTAMGSRGLTLALLCGELLAARLQGEPLPIDAKLATSLGTQRLAQHANRAPREADPPRFSS